MSDVEVICGYTLAWKRLTAAHRSNLRACLHVQRMQAVAEQALNPTFGREALEAAWIKFRRTQYNYLRASDSLTWWRAQMRERRLGCQQCSESINPGCTSCTKFITMGQSHETTEGNGSSAEVDGRESVDEGCATGEERVSFGGDMRLLDLEGRHDDNVKSTFFERRSSQDGG